MEDFLEKQEGYIRESPKFICDFMLGRLAKWLRLLGFDTSYYRNTNGKTIIHQSKNENRIILTRSKALKEKYEDAILIESENLFDQLKQVIKFLKIESPFSRCPVCNELIKKVKKETIKEEVPPYIFEVHHDFKKCPKCNRVFWKGTHYKEIEKIINEIKS
ncbi:MAG: Mut7-C RNAse domain-containing protein [candidate division WOR-3 bacterium]